MYNVILVDDEKIVLDGLTNFIDWESCGFHITSCCKDGNEAWDLCRSTEPDLLITDICMNGGDGLALINNVRSSDLKTEIIILTGYEDFHVAQSAVENNVLSILLKPLDQNTLYDALEKAKAKLQSNISNLHMRKAYINYNNSMLLHRLLNESNLTEETVSAILTEYQISLPNENYMIALIHIDTLDISLQKKLQITLINMLNQLALSAKNFMLINLLSPKNIPLLIYETATNKFDGILNLLKMIVDDFSHATGQTLTIGISLFFRNITAISKAFEQASKALQHHSASGGNRIIDYADINKSNVNTFLPLSKSEIEHFCFALKNFDKKAALSVINAFFFRVSECTHANIDDVRNNILELSIFTIRENSFHPIIIKEIFGRTLSPATELAQLQHVIDIKEWITEFALTLIDHPEIFLPQKYSKPIQDALIYIMANYTESLPASQIASRMYMSREHFARLFKKEVGMTYHEYLTNYRINIAKKLLESGEYNVSEVCAMVGYPNDNYFYKIFKKYTGKSPNQFTSKERGGY